MHYFELTAEAVASTDPTRKEPLKRFAIPDCDDADAAAPALLIGSLRARLECEVDRLKSLWSDL